jgi:hypothetical protein
VNSAPGGFSSSLRTSRAIFRWMAGTTITSALTRKISQHANCSLAVSCMSAMPAIGGKKGYNQRPDYDAALDLNVDMSIACSEVAAANE